MYLTEEHELIRSTVRDFARNEIKPLPRELDEKAEFSVELTKKMGKIGLLGMTVPEKYGGQGYDYLSYVIAVEELARVDGSGRYVAAHNPGHRPAQLFRHGRTEKEIPARLCNGEGLAFGLTEPEAGSDSAARKPPLN